MKYFLTLAFLISSQALASEAGHGGGHHDSGVPVMVLYQGINLLIFLGILVWFGRKPVRELFQTRYEEFNRLAMETEKARKDLEYKKADLIRRAELLKSTTQGSLIEARGEAEKYYHVEIAKAKEAALKMDKDVQSQITSDELKLFEKLREEALELSVASAQEQLQKVDAAEKAKLNQRFQQRVEGATL